jgi:hypothetical protein
MAGRKVFYTIGGTGRKAGEDSGKFRNIAPGRFTKGSTGRKPILSTQTRISASLIDVRLKTIDA